MYLLIFSLPHSFTGLILRAYNVPNTMLDVKCIGNLISMIIYIYTHIIYKFYKYIKFQLCVITIDAICVWYLRICLYGYTFFIGPCMGCRVSPDQRNLLTFTSPFEVH